MERAYGEWRTVSWLVGQYRSAVLGRPRGGVLCLLFPHADCTHTDTPLHPCVGEKLLRFDFWTSEGVRTSTHEGIPHVMQQPI